MGLEGIVSKRRGSRYRSGRSPHWVKAKNPESAAARREAVETGASGDDQRERPARRAVRDQGRRHRPHAPRLRETAIEAARSLRQRLPAAKIEATDLRDGAVVAF
jgi:hypothetical protein